MSWMSWNFIKFHKILFQTDAEKQKSFIPKKNIFYAVVSKYAKIVQKMALAVLIFSEGFENFRSKCCLKSKNIRVREIQTIL